MPRWPRVFVEGGIFHVYNRFARGAEIFAEPEEAIKFIEDNKDGPFFCYLPVTPPHGLFNIPDDDPAWKRYEGKVGVVEPNLQALPDILSDAQVALNVARRHAGGGAVGFAISSTLKEHLVTISFFGGL